MAAKTNEEKTIREKFDDLLREDSARLAGMLERHAQIKAVHFQAHQDAGEEHSIRFTLNTKTSASEMRTKVRTALINAGLHTPPRLGIRTSREANGPLNVILYGTSQHEKDTLAGLKKEIDRRNQSVVRRAIGRAPDVARKVGRTLARETFR